MKTFISQRRQNSKADTDLSGLWLRKRFGKKKKQNLQTRNNSKNELLYPNLMEDFKHLARVKESDFFNAWGIVNKFAKKSFYKEFSRCKIWPIYEISCIKRP